MAPFGRNLRCKFGKVWVIVGVEDGVLSSPVVTSYMLPLVTMGLCLAVFAVLRLVMDRRRDGQT